MSTWHSVFAVMPRSVFQRVLQECLPQCLKKCPRGVSCRAVSQESLPYNPYNSVLQKCLSKMPRKRVLQECPIRASQECAPQECLTRASKSGLQKYLSKVPHEWLSRSSTRASPTSASWLFFCACPSVLCVLAPFARFGVFICFVPGSLRLPACTLRFGSLCCAKLGVLVCVCIRDGRFVSFVPFCISFLPMD